MAKKKPAEKNSLTQILEERPKAHGDFTDVAACAQATKDLWRSRPGWDKLTKTQREGLEMIAHKVARVLSGNPNHLDHWQDLAGYATITADRITKEPT
jgi:Domain of unknown function (DUF6378)